MAAGADATSGGSSTARRRPIVDPGRRFVSRQGQFEATRSSASTARPTHPIRRRSGGGGRRSSTISPRAWTGRSRTSRHANHNPDVVVNGHDGKAPIAIDAEVGVPTTLDAAGTHDRDGNALTYTWFFYPEAGTGIPGHPVVTGPQRAGRRRRDARGRRHSVGTRRRAARASREGHARERDHRARDGDAAGGRDGARDSGRGGRRQPTLTSYRRVILTIKPAAR